MDSNEQAGKVPVEQAIEKYSEADAAMIGLPSPGALNLLNIFCKQIQGSPLMPASFMKAQNPGAALLSVILTGREMGFSPMQSLRAYWLSPDGRLGMYGAAMIAAMRKAGVKLDFLKDDDDGVEIKATRPDGETYTSRFTHEDAVKSGVWSREKSLHPRYPRRMCKWRCVSDIWNTLCSDLGGGGPLYTREEMAEMEPEVDGSSQVFREYADFTVGEKPVKQNEPAAATATQGTKQTAAEVKQETPATDPVKVETKPAAAETNAPKTETKAPAAESQPAPAETKVEEPIKTDPPPAKKGPVAVPEPEGKESMAKTQERLSLIYDKKSPDAMKQVMSKFMKGFLNVKTLPKPEEAIYRPIFRILERVLEDAPELLVEDPNGLGLSIGVAWRETKKKLEEWALSDRCKDAVFDVMLALQHTLSGGKLTCDYMEGLRVDKLAESDMFAYLQVARRTPAGEVCNAYLLFDQAEATKKRIADIVAGWGIDVDTAPIAGINALLEGGVPKAETVPEAVAAEAVRDDDGIPIEDEPGEREEIDDVMDLFTMAEE